MALINKKDKNALGLTIDALKHSIDQNPPVNSTLSKTVAFEGFEGINNADRGNLTTAINNFKSVINTTIKGNGQKELSEASMDAAVAAGVLALASESYHGIKVHTDADLSVLANESTVFMPGFTSGVEKRQYSSEAFDNTANRNALVYSLAYNAYASRQDEFTEAFFPTIVQTHDQAGYMVAIQLIEVINDIKREISGVQTSWNRKNVIKALKDSSILDNSSTKIVPIYRTESQTFFNADIGTKSVKIGQETVTTGTLLPGVSIDLLGISQTAASVAAGLNDTTDSIDSAVRLERVYIQLADDDIIAFNTKDIPSFTFNYAVQGNERLLQLNASTKTLQVGNATKKIDGAALTGAATVGTNVARIGIQVFGSINQQEGTTSITAGAVTFEGVFDANGVELGTGTTPGSSIKTLLTGATIVGFDLDARRTNSNRRQRGQLIDVRNLNYLYAVPVHAPITALRPVGQSDSQDQANISALITTTRIRTSNSGVGALIDAAGQLKAAKPLLAAGTPVEIFGAARELVIPQYIEETINVATQVDSLRSADRAEDIVNLLVNKIRDIAFRMHRDSNLKAADDALSGGESTKPLVLIGTDVVTGRYLTLLGDTRLLGDAFDYKVVTTVDNRMIGKIFVTFGKNEALNSGASNPLHFGNMAWRPELTLALPNTRNGAQTMELTVQPSYIHVPNLPVLAEITVTGIETVIASKVAINNHPV